jgi:hypothetical protein
VAEALILDSEALNVLANTGARGPSLQRARAIMAVALENRSLVRVPAPVLAELYRGPRFDVALDRVLNDRGIGVVDLTREVARRAGHLLARAKLSSAHAVDAFVVATALTYARAIIATSDPTDIGLLAAPFPQVRVFAL